MNSHNRGSSKPSKGKKYQSWIPVQTGLFAYPPSKGQRPALLANRCTRCGKAFFPKRSLCPNCYDMSEMESIILDGRGIIYASTVVHVDSPVGIKAPYAYGYVEMPAHQVRVCGLFTGGDPASFTPGQEVELVIEPVRMTEQGQQVIGYKFRPVS